MSSRPSQFTSPFWVANGNCPTPPPCCAGNPRSDRIDNIATALRSNETISKAKCKTKRGNRKLLVKLLGGLPGDSFVVDLTSGQQKDGSLNGKGKGKAKFNGLPAGNGTATVTWGCGNQKEKAYVCR